MGWCEPLSQQMRACLAQVKAVMVDSGNAAPDVASARSFVLQCNKGAARVWICVGNAALAAASLIVWLAKERLSGARATVQLPVPIGARVPTILRTAGLLLTNADGSHTVMKNLQSTEPGQVIGTADN